jgi:hypothetical protein
MTSSPPIAASRTWPAVARGLFWSLAASVVLSTLLGVLVEIAPERFQGVLLFGAAELLVLAGLTMAVLAGERPRVGVFGLFGTGPGSRPVVLELGLGIALGASIKGPADMLRALVEQRWPTSEQQLAAQMEFLRHDTAFEIASLLLMIGFAGPFVEELFYRGALWRTLQRGAGPLGALAFSSVGFVFAHAGPRDWPSLLGVALLLGATRATTGRLWAALGAHVAFNTCALVMLIQGAGVEPGGGWVSWLWTLGGTLSAVGLLVVLRAGTRCASP